jgi:hypothetical protein
MAEVLNALLIGLAIIFMIIGMIGILVPILPGTLLIWLAVLAYAIVEGFQAIDAITFTFITLIALITGTADLWLSLLGSKKGGASWQAMLVGLFGGIIGFFLFGSLVPVIGNLVGGIIGYSLGVLVGQYLKVREWKIALKATIGGLVGWGIATIVQIVGGIFMMIIFIWQVLSY